MMPSIHGGRGQVSVWLGDFNTDSDHAINFIERIMKDNWKLYQLCEDRLGVGNYKLVEAASDAMRLSIIIIEAGIATHHVSKNYAISNKFL